MRLQRDVVSNFLFFFGGFKMVFPLTFLNYGQVRQLGGLHFVVLISAGGGCMKRLFS